MDGKLGKFLTVANSVSWIAIWFMCGFACTFGIRGMIYEHRNKIGSYERQAIVVESKDNKTVFEDKTGNLWSYGFCDIDEGKTVTLLMSDNGTKSIYDDAILDVIK